MVSIPSIINMGYTAADILGVISQKNRPAASKIRRALSLGYSASTILSHLSGGKGDDSEYVTEAERTTRAHKKQTRKALATIGGTALGALGLAGGLAALGGRVGVGTLANVAGATANATAQGSPGATPPISPSNSPTTSPQQQINLPPIVQNAPTQAQAQAAQSQANQTIASYANPIATNQSPAQVNPTEPEFDYYQTKTHKSFGDRLTRFVEKHRDAGIAPEETEDLVKKSSLTKGLVPYFEKETGKPISEAIKNIYGKQVPISIQSPVISPDGSIGTVSHQKDHISIVDTGSGKEKHDTKNLIPIPEEWNHLHLDFSKVPEEERSSNLSMVAPTEDKKKLVIQFWDVAKEEPKLYVYRRKDGNPVDEDVLNSIAQETDVPITNGIKFSGAWSTSGKSRGSAFYHKLKTMAQSEDEPDDPSKPYIFERAPITFQHGMIKLFRSGTAEKEKQFNEYHYPKKRK